MKHKSIVGWMAAGLMIGLVSAVSLPVWASPVPPRIADQGADNDPVDFHGKVEAIDLKAMTLTVDKKVILVGEKTKILKADKPVALDALQVGNEVHGLTKLNEQKKVEAILIKVGPPQKPDAGSRENK